MGSPSQWRIQTALLIFTTLFVENVECASCYSDEDAIGCGTGRTSRCNFIDGAGTNGAACGYLHVHEIRVITQLFPVEVVFHGTVDIILALHHLLDFIRLYVANTAC